MSVYGISEVAKKLGVRRQSVYRRLDRTELNGHIYETDKGKCIDVEGIAILRELFKVSKETVNGQSNSDHGTTKGQVADTYTKSLEEQLIYLKSIIAEKDKQISDLTQVTLNGQVLLKQEQEKNKLLLEASQAPQEASKGFLSRIFKK